MNCEVLLWLAGVFQVALVVKNLPANAGNARDAGSVPLYGRSSAEGNGNLFQYSCLENLMDRGAWQATVHGVTESDTTDWQHRTAASSAGKDVKSEPLCPVDENINWYSHWGKDYGGFWKNLNRTTLWSSSSTSGCIPKELKVKVSKRYLYTHVHSIFHNS